MPFGLQPQGRHFPRRNRIVSGLSQAVIVVEAAARSGSLITARAALDQGREVMAVPGHPLDSRASGGNILLRDGATLVRSTQDVIEALGAATEPRPAVPPAVSERPVNAPRPPLPDGGVEALVLERLSVTPLDEDQLIRDTGQPPPGDRAGPRRSGNGRSDHAQPRWPRGADRGRVGHRKNVCFSGPRALGSPPVRTPRGGARGNRAQRAARIPH